MDVSKIDNVTNELNMGKNIIPHSPSYTQKVRITLKEGITNLRIPYSATKVTSIHDGEGIIPWAQEFIPKSKNIVLYLKNTSTASYDFFQNTSKTTLNGFLSSIDVLHDPLPWLRIQSDYYGRGIVISNENFTAPNGIFDNIIELDTFAGSELKVGPKIFSDKALSETPAWPPIRLKPFVRSERKKGSYFSDTWKPFTNVKNMESIAHQGTISGDKLIYVGDVDLTFEDEKGFTKLSAYPKMEAAPRVIIDYVKGKKVRLTDIPNTLINVSRATKVFMPVEFEEYVLAKPNLPFAGMDFRGNTHHMDVVTLDDMTVTNYEEFNQGLYPDSEYENFIISYLHLGIIAPESCAVVENLHTLYTNYAEYEERGAGESWLNYKKRQKVHLLTLDTLENLNGSWANELRRFLEDEAFMGEPFYDNNMVPLIPENVERLTGYLSRWYIVNDYTFIEPGNNYVERINLGVSTSLEGFWYRPSAEQRVLTKDGQPYLWELNPIVLKEESEELQLTATYRNLFSCLFLDLTEPLIVPKTPDKVVSLIMHGFGMFANSTGTLHDEKVSEAEPSKQKLFYTRSRLELAIPEGDESKYTVNIEDIANTTSSQFFNWLEDKNSDENYIVIDGEYEGVDGSGYPIIKPNGLSLSTNSTTGGKKAYDLYNNPTDETNTIKKINNETDFFNFVYDYGTKPVKSVFSRINNNIFFEDVSYDSSYLRSTLYTWAQLFFGASPYDSTNLSLPNVPETGKNVDDFFEAFLYKYTNTDFHKPMVCWGYFETDGQLYTHGVKYAILFMYDNPTPDYGDAINAGYNTAQQFDSTGYVWNTDVSLPRIQKYIKSLSYHQLGENTLASLQLQFILKGMQTPIEEVMDSNLMFAFEDEEAINRDFEIAGSVLKNVNHSAHWPLKNPNLLTSFQVLQGSKNISSIFGIKTFSKEDWAPNFVNNSLYDFDMMNYLEYYEPNII